ncbi:MAG: HPr family phosphocarrier protein [Lachnospiraceae bacterium]|jgi:phosphotransferase system HPr-like phosphotransfer protein|nr:HPr family phosphocarrier protein [Lachnospiraceae bacterium]
MYQEYSKTYVLKTGEAVQAYIKLAKSFDGDIDLVSGTCIIDGKSLLGVLSLRLQDGVRVIVRTDSPEKAERFFNELAQIRDAQIA